jgi:hypothetical protein
MAAFIQDVASIHLNLLRSQPPTKAPSKKAGYEIALILLQTFGDWYAESLQGRMPKELRIWFASVHISLFEIQKRLRSGSSNFVETLCPATAPVIRGFGEDEIGVFLRLKTASYALISFPQKLIFSCQNLEPGVFDQLEFERHKGFNALLRSFPDRPNAMDHKGNEFAKGCQLRPDEELAMVQLYYRGGALFLRTLKSPVVYFSEVVWFWSRLSPQNQQKFKAFIENLPGKSWVQDQHREITELVTFDGIDQPADWSLLKYLAATSVAIVANNLEIELFPRAKRKIFTDFFESESVRSDLCYFSGFPNKFCNYQAESSQRKSKFLIRTLQAFLFLKRKSQIPEEELPILLNILLFMKFDLNQISKADVQEFSKAWDCFKRILNLIKGREISFSDPADEDEEFVCDPNCWNLLFFLWRHENREVFVAFFESLKKIQDFDLTLLSVWKFCECNQTFTTNYADSFIQACHNAMVTLAEKGVDTLHPECLFFTPAFEVRSVTVLTYGFTVDRTNKFLKRINPHLFENRQFCLMLRNYILRPRAFLFDLLDDCAAMGVKVDEDLQCHVFVQVRKPLEPTLAARNTAKAIIQEIKAKGDFTAAQIFDLYEAVLHAIMDGHEEQIQKVKDTILTLQSFCPRLSAESCLFLFRYPSKERILSHAHCLQEAHVDWVNDDDEDLDRFVVDQQKYTATLNEIRGFAEKLSQTCPPDPESPLDPLHRSRKFCEFFKVELFSAFYSSAQPFTDFLNIGGLSSKRIEWINLHLKTHEGQLLFFKYSGVSLYLNWQVLNDRPVLHVFYKKGKKTASAFLVLEISAAEISIAEKKGPFYVLLSRLAQEVLIEEASENPDPAEHPEPWVSAYTGAAQTINDSGLGPEFVEPIRRFLLELKRTRKLYLRVVANPPLPDLPEEEQEVAAAGCIYESAGHLSLLPENHGAHPEHFSPDADAAQVETLRGHFNQSTQEPQPLDLNLQTTDGQLPISYHVQSKGEWIDDPLDQGDEAGKYVTLFCGDIRVPLRYLPEVLADPAIFAGYFKLHNLFLKASYYFQKTMD